MANQHALHVTEVYTGETEPPGAKLWIPLSKNGILLRTNVSKIAKDFPVKIWVYDKVVLEHLCSFPYQWPFTILMYAEGIGLPRGRWKEERSFRPGIDDI